jgi:hypothetical protein
VKKAHPDCLFCHCWQAEDDEVITAYLNGHPVIPGSLVTLRQGDRLEYVATKAQPRELPDDGPAG